VNFSDAKILTTLLDARVNVEDKDSKGIVRIRLRSIVISFLRADGSDDCVCAWQAGICERIADAWRQGRRMEL